MGLLIRIGASVASVAAVTAGVQSFAIPSAAAAPCPDAEIVFARGTTELPGPGPTGQAFVDALSSRVTGRSVGLYAVDYPATMAFSTAVQGIADARSHILATVASCPDTKLVLGGFSQGAAVMGFVTANVVPEGVTASDVPTPMPLEVADHVAAVTLFGKPSTRFMSAINDPDIVVGPRYEAKAIEFCVDNDLVCDPHGRSLSAHNQYADAGLVDQGAAFAAQRLGVMWAADAAADAVEGAPDASEPAPTQLPPGGPTGPLPGPAPLPQLSTLAYPS
jgi:hypothetical protein